MTPLLRISPAAVVATINQLRALSAGGRESAAFWIGSREDLQVQAVVIPEGRGVVLRPLSIQISEEWMNLLGEFCDSTGQIVLGGVHCHPEGWSAYSEIDADGFFHAPDFVSVVLPHYGRTNLADADRDWGVYVGRPWGAWRRSLWSEDVAIEGSPEVEIHKLRLPE